MELADNSGSGEIAAVTATDSGSSLSAAGITVGSATRSSGTLTVSNSAVLNGSGNVNVNATGEIDVLSGGTMTFNGNLSLFGGGAGRGNLILMGTNSAADQTAGTITIGTSGAKLQINTGTTYTIGGGGGTFVNSGGLIDINDGTFNANGNVSVTGGTLQRTSAGTFTWASGKMMFVQSGGMVNITGDYTTPTSASINIAGSGSAFQQLTSGGLNIATGTTVNVQNTGLLSGLALTVGATGLVNVDGGTFNESGDISLNGGTLTQTSTAGSTFTWSAGHTMTVQTGGQFNVFGTYITPNNSTINLTGATSQINSTGSTGFNVANGSTLNVSNGASVNVAGIISVDFLSMINFSSGTMTVGDLRTLQEPHPFQLNDALLNITGTGGVEVGSAAELGSPFFVAPACVLNVTNATAIDASAKLQAFGLLTSGSLNNGGELDAIGTTVTLTSASTNVSGGKINLISSTLNLGSGANKLTNTGRINLTDVTVNGDIQSNSGGVINTAGNVVFNGSISGGASLLTISDGVTKLADNDVTSRRSPRHLAWWQSRSARQQAGRRRRHARDVHVRALHRRDRIDRRRSQRRCVERQWNCHV